MWRTVLWALLFPSRSQRIQPTLAGIVLIALSLGIGTAAYNSGNNILFLTLSLLLACLILSGVLSWLNFKDVSWRLKVRVPLRVGLDHPVTLELRNAKNLLPTYGLWFDIEYEGAVGPPRIQVVRRLDPNGETEVSWTVSPQRRGSERIRVSYVGSLFPFGFLRKSLSTRIESSALVWPAAVEYRHYPVPSWRQVAAGASVSRVGNSGDLFALRKYESGDSRRSIHWKTSARARRLMVRQNTAEREEGFALWFEATRGKWPRPGQFELACSFAATLAEDLFLSGRLQYTVLDDRSPLPVRGVRDLEMFLDQIALLPPFAAMPEGEGAGVARRARSGGSPPRLRNLLGIFPDGANSVAAYINGEKAAST